MKTIEQLQYQANSVKLELEALKKLAEATKEEKELKEKKTKNLTDQIASITLELNNRILVLKDKTDTSSLEELKKAEEVLKILDDSSSELTNLQKNVVDQLSAGISDVTDKTTDIAEKVGDTMGVRDKDAKKMNWGKTAAWVGGAIGATWLFSTVKGWFSGNDKKESEEKKEEGFFNHGIGKGIKYAAIGVAGFFGIKRLLDYFNKDKAGRDPENTEKPSDAVNLSWEKLQQDNPEKAKQATNIATQVNDCRSKQILQNSDGRVENDMLGETTSTSDFVFDKAPGAIIAHMDAQYNSVSDMLDKDDYVMNTIQSLLNKPYYAVMERGEEKVTNILKPLAGIVTGILPGHRGSDDKLTAEGKAELAKPNPERDQQLHNIFAKYMRVKLWYNLKIQQLREKLTKDELGSNATAGDVENYLDNDKKRKVIDAKIESQFLNLKLIDSTQFLTQQGIKNDMLPENMKEVITDINDEYKNYHTSDIEKVLQKNENPSIHKEGLTKSCNEFIAHLTEPAVSRNMVTGLWHTLGVDIRANNTGADIDAIAKQMGFDQIVSGYQKDVTDISLKIANGTATKEDIKHLHDLMESFRMLQIEITLGGMVKNESDGQGGFVDKIVTRFGEWTMGIVKDEEGNWNWKTIAFAGGIYLLRKPLGFVVKPVAKASWNTLKFIGRAPMMSGTLRGLANRVPTFSYMRSLKYSGDIGKTRLIKDIANKNISLEQAEHVYKRVRGDIAQSKSFDELIKSEFGGKTVAQLDSELKAGKNILPSTKNIDILNKNIDNFTKEIDSATKLAAKETRKVFSTFDTTVNKLAKTKSIQKGTPAYKALSQQVRASEQYAKNKKLIDGIAQHNTSIAHSEKSIMQHFNKASWVEKQKLYTNPIVKRMVDANGGLANRKIPGRTGRMIGVGLHALMLGWVGSQDNADGTKKTLKETSLDVADFGISMVPVLGGAYDMGVAIDGTDLNGNELSTSERRIRGGIGLISIPLDIFTFGGGGTLLKGVAKGGTKLAIKTGEKVVAKEVVEFAVEGGVKTFAKKTLKSAGRDILLGTTAGVILMPVMGKLQQVSLDDEPKVTPSQNPIITKQAA